MIRNDVHSFKGDKLCLSRNLGPRRQYERDPEGEKGKTRARIDLIDLWECSCVRDVVVCSI